MKFPRWFVGLVMGAMALSMVLPAIMRGAEPASAPATQGGTAALFAELKQLSGQLQDLMPSINQIVDEKFRSGPGQKAIEPFKKSIVVLAKIEPTQPADDQKEIQAARSQYQTILAALGDKETVDSLKVAAAGGDAEKAIDAKSALVLADWWTHSSDATSQAKQLDDYVAVAKANPTSDRVTLTLMSMANLGAANDDLKNKAVETIKTMTSPASRQILATIAALQEQRLAVAESRKKQAESLGKPLTVEGRTSTGVNLTTADMKGKVILVDFWATWCIPCRALLPGVKKVYDTYHAQGFEIVGVNCDAADEAVNTFDKESGIPWPSLHDEAAQSGDDFWHPLTHKLGIGVLPTMYLIDRKGVLRHIDAEEDTEAKVKALLAEK